MVRLLALAGLIAALSVPAAAQAATSVQKAPFVGDVVLCTSGDVVHITGTLLTTVTESQTSSGGFLEAIHFQPQGISGVDTTTGTAYHATGLTRDLLVSSPAGGSTETSVNRFHIQATRSAESFIVKGLFHITVSSTGSVRVVIDMFSATC